MAARRRRPTAAARAADGAAAVAARGELDGGAWALALRLLVHIVADASLAQVVWEAHCARLEDFLLALAPPNPPPPRAPPAAGWG